MGNWNGDGEVQSFAGEGLRSRSRSGSGPLGADPKDSIRLQGGTWGSSKEKLPQENEANANYESGPACEVGSKTMAENCFVIDIKRYILLSLGYPNVEVELCDEHLETAIRDTLSEFTRHNALNAMRFWRIPLTPFQATYDLPHDLRVVRDVTILRYNDWNQIFGTGVLINPLYMRNTANAYQDILTFWLSGAAFETWKRVYGLETSWDVHEGNKLINIYPTPNHAMFAIIKGTYRVTLDDLDDRALGNKDELFRRMALARARIILGDVRGKYPGGVTSSQGPVQLDGDYQRQVGKQEWDEARQELRSSGRPAGFYRG